MKIFVGNIGSSVNENDLQNLFSSFGDIEIVQIIYDKLTGESRKFGYIKMADKKDALTAIEKLNGEKIGGKELIVNRARKVKKGREQGNRRSGPPKF
jgi:RNA recognition motif-containing protein